MLINAEISKTAPFCSLANVKNLETSMIVKPKNVVVVDLGASTCRAGFAGDDVPKITFPSIVGKPKVINPADPVDFMVGAGVKSECEPISVKCPFKNGFIQNKEDYTKLFTHIFRELHIGSERRPVVLSEPIDNPTKNRQQLAEVLFETFRVPSIFIGSAPSLALYTSCKTEGVSLDIGDSFAQVASIYEWSQMPQTLLRTELGGKMITRFFLKSLKDSSYHFGSPTGLQLAQDVKESHGVICLDFNETMKGDIAPCEYEVANDTKIPVGKDRFRCPELLFQPKLDNVDCYGAAELVYESIMRSDIGMRDKLFSNIVISGGSTLFTGFEDRLKKDLESMATPGTVVNVVADVARKDAVWVGGSILGSMELFPQMVVTREEYAESQGAAVRRKFY